MQSEIVFTVKYRRYVLHITRHIVKSDKACRRRRICDEYKSMRLPFFGIILIPTAADTTIPAV
jgi:hypothetical protein